MKYTALVALMLMIPVVLLAAPKNSANVTFTQTVTVNGTRIPPGDYRVEWQPTSTGIEASFRQGKQVVASAPATVVDAKNSYYPAVETSDGQNNSKVLEAIDLSNRSLRFVQGNNSSPSTTTAGAAN